MVWSFFYLAAGFVLLVLSGDKLVENSVQIAKRLHIPASVIAVTLIAAGTSAPELVTSMMAAYNGINDISIGNVVGSNIFNILAIGGLTFLIQPKSAVKSAFFSWPVLVVATFLFTFFLNDFQLSRMEGILFVVALNAFILFSFFKKNDDDVGSDGNHKSWGRIILFTLVSFVGLIFGAQLALDGGVAIGQGFGLSERVIGITIISVGTGLPELATSLAAAARGRNDIAVANIIGSNIFNTLGIPGAVATLFPLMVNEQLFNLDTFVMIAATIAVGACFVFTNKIMRRILGLAFLASYTTYVVYLVMT